MENLTRIISIMILTCIFTVSCVNVAPMVTSPQAAVAYAGVSSVAQIAMPIFMIGCIGILIAKRTKEFKDCTEPISPDMVDTCEQYRVAEETRKQNVH